jgi:hypothetical protein
VSGKIRRIEFALLRVFPAPCPVLLMLVGGCSARGAYSRVWPPQGDLENRALRHITAFSAKMKAAGPVSPHAVGYNRQAQVIYWRRSYVVGRWVAVSLAQARANFLIVSSGVGFEK